MHNVGVRNNIWCGHQIRFVLFPREKYCMAIIGVREQRGRYKIKNRQTAYLESIIIRRGRCKVRKYIRSRV